MASCSNAQSSESGHMGGDNVLPAIESAVQSRESPRHDEDEEEDEDIEFNPFLKETLSPGASSSLSSEVEGLDDDGVYNVMEPSHIGVVDSSHLTGGPASCLLGDSERAEEELLVQATITKACGDERQPRLLEVSCPTENENFQEEDHETNKGDFDGIFVNEAGVSGKPDVLLDDDDDAICKRTRARYSLASFTLDELESFLQETDDDEDLQKVDDEEEYRKFLAAVLQGGDSDDLTIQENGNVDDEDEDNDADFEIELEEALDSDLDDRQRDKSPKSLSERSRRRPETRHNGRRNSTSNNKKKSLEQAKRPLRPLLPLVPIGPNQPVSTPDSRLLTANAVADSGYISGFTPHQIGQLYCLIHEHVQLLIQIYSLCVLDPSRQQIASQVQELLLQILHKRDQVLAWRNIPYPADLFRTPYLISSVSDGSPRLFQDQSIIEPFMNNAQVNSASDCDEANGFSCHSNGQPEQINSVLPGSSQSFKGFLWAPTISGPIFSILDVAPLNLVRNYMDDMSVAGQEHRRRHVESSFDVRSEREPLFLLPTFPYAGEVAGAGSRELPTESNKGPSSSSQPIKKSLAASLVETTKKQSVALVPKRVAQLAQKFLPLFNQALFPHKPPPVSVANRVLFTDAEDEPFPEYLEMASTILSCYESMKQNKNSFVAFRRLLALGMMEYNTDWKAIQERFLPCKSKHQIFVRQKNRCSSKSAENPIKAVRRMKTSPLTMEEIRYIQEGLKFYKLDFMSIWKFIVPHRDPSLLPRQWRIAMGTQKSYKQNAVRKEKRRIYEAERRRRKAADPAQVSHGSEEDCGSGGDCIDDPEEAYVHEAFLADWRPGTSLPRSNHDSEAVEAQHTAGNIRQYITTQMNHLQHPFATSRVPYTNSNQRIDSERLVKLAPNLPPVNLPRNVRVLSQSAYSSHQHVAKVGPTSETRATNVPDSYREGSSVVDDDEDRFNSSGLQMHPLLFQVPVEPSTSGSFSFFPGSQPQLNLSLFRSHNDPNILNRSVIRNVNSTVSGIEFHPLLQRTDNAESNPQSSGHGPVASVAYPQSPLSKAHELDLEINLSSTSRKSKDLERRDKAISGVPLVSEGNSCPLPGSLIARGLQAMDDDVGRSYTCALDYQSHQEIVMEQEELSDSEEEFEEQVEFECEEMDDSDEDVSGADLAAEASAQDAENPPVEKVPNETQGERYREGDRHCRPDVSNMSETKDKKSSKSWLTLCETPDVENSARSSRGNRSRRMTKEPVKMEVEKRPRKRPCRTKKSSNTGLP